MERLPVVDYWVWDGQSSDLGAGLVKESLRPRNLGLLPPLRRMAFVWRAAFAVETRWSLLVSVMSWTVDEKSLGGF